MSYPSYLQPFEIRAIETQKMAKKGKALAAREAKKVQKGTLRSATPVAVAKVKKTNLKVAVAKVKKTAVAPSIENIKAFQKWVPEGGLVFKKEELFKQFRAKGAMTNEQVANFKAFEDWRALLSKEMLHFNF